jgi:UDP-N-acetylmuramate dehydrogenase
MKIKKNVSLKPYNQFGVDVRAKYFAQPVSIDEVQELISQPKLNSEKKVILGGGNNTLFVGDFNGLVIKPEIKGKKIVEKNDKRVLVKIGAGENWDDFVRWTVDQDWGGLENLIAIPAAVGGAVSQNIGAYGQEISDVIEKVEAINLKTGKQKVFFKKDCQFSYRSSIFKHKIKNKFLITYLYFCLTPFEAGYELNYEYNSLKEELEKRFSPPYSLRQVMEAVEAQRRKKLPDIGTYGTCGCFFTNPVVKKEKYQQLKQIMPDLVCYPTDKEDNRVKIPAGKLVDELGWKGKWQDKVGVSKKHALCIVTRRQASGKEILDLAEKIRRDVFDTYGIKLDFEVNVVEC